MVDVPSAMQDDDDDVVVDAVEEARGQITNGGRPRGRLIKKMWS